jgi:hypothetical protein
MGVVFAEPVTEPRIMFEYIHEHDWFQVGAKRNPSGVWSSLWRCSLCPDVGVGGETGPVPDGYCYSCGWVQHKAKRKRCEECKQPLPGEATR